MADAESAEGDRPSFTSFWKRVKQKEKGDGGDQQKKKGKKSASPSSTAELQLDEGGEQDQDPDENTGEAGEEAGAKDKAQLRRAQVRKAQIQHRQRKANYVKQLELDVSQLRDLITQAQQETSQIRKENDSIRDIIRRTEPSQFTYPQADSTYFSNADSPSTRLGGMSELDTQEWLSGGQLSDLDLNQHPLMPSTSNDAEMFGHINVDDITVSLGIHDLLGTPCFTINNSSTGSSVQGYASPPSFENAPLTPPLTPQQEQTVINWVLALENICWNHFHSNDFHDHIPGETEEATTIFSLQPPSS
ncbi:hypothetical protein TrVFT333_005187 [Trichoderma virens FT-333]|nr:hypothetical protein TrVFT333_005187 [Trichoderma virens FT-333]